MQPSWSASRPPATMLAAETAHVAGTPQPTLVMNRGERSDNHPQPCECLRKTRHLSEVLTCASTTSLPPGYCKSHARRLTCSGSCHPPPFRPLGQGPRDLYCLDLRAHRRKVRSTT